MSSSNSSPVVAPAQVSFADVVHAAVNASAAVPAPSTLANTESEPESGCKSFASAVIDATGNALAELLFETYFTGSVGKKQPIGPNAISHTSATVGGLDRGRNGALGFGL